MALHFPREAPYFNEIPAINAMPAAMNCSSRMVGSFPRMVGSFLSIIETIINIVIKQTMYNFVHYFFGMYYLYCITCFSELNETPCSNHSLLQILYSESGDIFISFSRQYCRHTCRVPHGSVCAVLMAACALKDTEMHRPAVWVP